MLDFGVAVTLSFFTCVFKSELSCLYSVNQTILKIATLEKDFLVRIIFRSFAISWCVAMCSFKDSLHTQPGNGHFPNVITAQTPLMASLVWHPSSQITLSLTLLLV